MSNGVEPDKVFKLGVKTFEANCAGQGCPEREGCLRYLRPSAQLGQAWASFDLERQIKDSCPAMDEPSHAMKAAIRRLTH